MNDQKKSVSEAAQNLKDLAKSVSDNDPGLGGEINLLANNMESLAATAPTRLTSDFDIAGGEVPFPQQTSEGTEILERIIGTNDLLPASFLELGAKVQRSVARVMLKKAHGGLPPGSGWGTGFLISPSLFLTNNHVIPDTNMAKKVRIQFNYQVDSEGLDKASDIYETAALEMFHTNVALDYTLLKVRSKQFSNDAEMGTGVFPPGNRWGYIELNDSPAYLEGLNCNVIQHPDGRKKEVALQKNEIQQLFANTVRYKADTEGGSSGSPVFDNFWQLIALHHAAGSKNAAGDWVDNEGMRIDKIVEDLRQSFENTHPEIISELGI